MQYTLSTLKEFKDLQDLIDSYRDTYGIITFVVSTDYKLTKDGDIAAFWVIPSFGYAEMKSKE